MTLTLGESTPQRLDVSKVYPKDYPADRAPIHHLTDWFDRNPPASHPVRIRPVERVKPQMERDLDDLMGTVPYEPNPDLDKYWRDKAIKELKGERDTYHGRYIGMIVAFIFLLVLSGYLLWSAGVRIRGLTAMVEQSKHATVFYPSAEAVTTKNAGGSAAIAPPSAEASE